MLDQSLIDWGSSKLSAPEEIALEASRLFSSRPNATSYKTTEEAVQRAFLAGIHYWTNTQDERKTRSQWVKALEGIVEATKSTKEESLTAATLNTLDQWGVEYPTGWRSTVE